MTEDSGKARGILAVLLLLLLVAVNVTLILVHPTDDFTKTQLNTLNGAMLLQLGIVFGFYFGSSSGSKTLSQASIETNKTLVDAVATSAPVVVKPPEKRVEAPPPTVNPAPSIVDDPEFVKFREMVLTMNKDATEADIASAWAGLKSKVDIPT